MEIVDLLLSGSGSGIARLAYASLELEGEDVQTTEAVRAVLGELFKRDSAARRRSLAVGAVVLEGLRQRPLRAGTAMLVDLLRAAALARTDALDAAQALVDVQRRAVRGLLDRRAREVAALATSPALRDRARAAWLREESLDLEVAFEVIALDVLPTLAAAAPQEALPERRLVLVVDDDDDIRTAVGLLLEGNGFDVANAENGAAAVTLLEQGLRPNAIILDLMMPVMNGWDFHAWQLQRPALSSPTLVFTAMGVREGAVGKLPMLSKTADAGALLREVRRLVAA